MSFFNPFNFRVRLFIFSALLLCVMTAPDSSAAHQCSYCFKKIDGQWLEVDGKYYHPNHFICSNCLKAITHQLFYEHDGKYYDSTCFATFITKRCDYCGKPIIDEAVNFETNTYHASCYNESVGQRCVVGGEVVTNQFFIDDRGNAVCQNHKEEALRCNACQQFLTPVYNGGWEQLTDGRHICTQCAGTAVYEIRDANELIEEVKAELEAAGIDVDEKYKLAFVSLQELNSKFDDYLVDHLGVTLYQKSEMLGGLFSSKKFEIRVLYGLPRSLLRSVLAHELMHVWLFANAPQPQNQQMCEGTCQYAAYLVLQNDQTDDGRYFLDYLMKQEDEIYGEGFNKVLGYVNSVGLNPWLDYLRENKDAPW